MFSYKDLRFKNSKYEQAFLTNYVLNKHVSFEYEDKWDLETETLSLSSISGSSIPLLLTMIDNSNPTSSISIIKSSRYLRKILPDSAKLHLGEITYQFRDYGRNSAKRTLLQYLMNNHRSSIRKFLTAEAYHNYKKYIYPNKYPGPYLPLDQLPDPIIKPNTDLEITTE